MAWHGACLVGGMATDKDQASESHTNWCKPGDCRCEAMAEIRRLSALPMGKGPEIHGRMGDTVSDGRSAYETARRLF